MKLLYTIIIGIFFLVPNSIAQHNHNHKRNELGISTGGLYGIDHKEWGTGLHIHYFRTLGDHSAWAIGGYAEYGWFDDSHYSVGAGVKYEIIERLHIGVFPGIVFLKHGDEDVHKHDSNHSTLKSKFSFHSEIIYDLIQWDKFHIGPVIDYSWARDDSHVMLGVHAAFSF